MSGQTQIDVNDLIAAYSEMLASAHKELAIAVARGNALLRENAELKKAQEKGDGE